jgi:hypothetical protein
MTDFYIFNGRLRVIGKVTADTQKDAERIAASRHGVPCRATEVRGMTEEEAERYLREELSDDK